MTTRPSEARVPEPTCRAVAGPRASGRLAPTVATLEPRLEGEELGERRCQDTPQSCRADRLAPPPCNSRNPPRPCRTFADRIASPRQDGSRAEHAGARMSQKSKHGRAR